MQSAKPDFGEIVCGVVVLAVGIGFLWSARSALFYHIPIYFKGPSYMYPWQAIIGGGLSFGLGLCLIIHGFCRNRKPSGDT
jgi:hypothetical protein